MQCVTKCSLSLVTTLSSNHIKLELQLIGWIVINYSWLTALINPHLTRVLAAAEIHRHRHWHIHRHRHWHRHWHRQTDTDRHRHWHRQTMHSTQYTPRLGRGILERQLHVSNCIRHSTDNWLQLVAQGELLWTFALPDCHGDVFCTMSSMFFSYTISVMLIVLESVICTRSVMQLETSGCPVSWSQHIINQLSTWPRMLAVTGWD